MRRLAWPRATQGKVVEAFGLADDLPDAEAPSVGRTEVLGENPQFHSLTQRARTRQIYRRTPSIGVNYSFVVEVVAQ